MQNIEKENGERFTIFSRLENLEGNHSPIQLKRGPDGKALGLRSFDIDLTFLDLEEVLYPEARRILWPNINPEQVDKIHLAGFRLGTMFKEMYRMKMLNDHPNHVRYGKWVDADLYEKDFLEIEGQHINEPGDRFHQVANLELHRFDEVATQVARDVWHKHPESYDRAKIGPVFQLAEQYRRLGIPMVGMTANPRGFIAEVLKYTELADKFVECATDYDVPGDKEYKLKWLVEQLEHDGIPIPLDKLVVIGDSVTGDVGSGPRFVELMKKEQPGLPVDVRGLLIVDSQEALTKARAKLAGKPYEQALVGTAEALRWDKVKQSPHGTYDMTTKFRKEFMEPIVMPQEAE